MTRAEVMAAHTYRVMPDGKKYIFVCLGCDESRRSKTRQRAHDDAGAHVEAMIRRHAEVAPETLGDARRRDGGA